MNSTRSRPYGADVNFLASSQAREDETGFMKVKRAQWIGCLVGEEPMPGFVSKSKKVIDSAKEVTTAFWNVLALHEQSRIISGLKSQRKKSSSVAAGAAKEPAATGKVTVDDTGVITIPSAACSNPAESTKTVFHGRLVDRIVFVKNQAGDTFLHFSRYSSENDSFAYTFAAPKGGTYKLTADVVTPKPNQRLFASANGAKDVEIALPYTIGTRGKTEPVEIELARGENVLTFHGPARVTIDHFTLVPVK